MTTDELREIINKLLYLQKKNKSYEKRRIKEWYLSNKR